MYARRNKPESKSVLFYTSIDINKFAIYIMLIIYPLLVVPNSLGYFYFPRYILLMFTAELCIFAVIKEKGIKPSWVFIPLALYILCILISSIKAINTSTAWLGLFGIQEVTVAGYENILTLVSTSRFTGFITILGCVIMYLTAYKADKNDKLINAMIVCASIVGLISLLQYFGINIVPHEASRDGLLVYGTMGNPNFLATYTVFIQPAAIYKYIKSDGKLWLICSAFIYVGLLVSCTRGAWIAGAISMIITAVYYLRNKQYRKLYVEIVISLAVVTTILMSVNDGYIFKRALSIPVNLSSGLQLDDSSGSGRMHIWKETLKLIPDNWAFGVGLDNLIYCGITTANGYVDKAHNIYLETAATMGIPALVFYLTFLSFFIFRRWRTDKDFMFFSMISTYLMQGFFNIDVIMVLPLFWIILGLYQGNIEKEKLIEGSFGARVDK